MKGIVALVTGSISVRRLSIVRELVKNDKVIL